MTVHRAAHIATKAISLARAEESFQLPDLKDRVDLDDVPANSTFRRILRQLEQDDWLERDHPEGRTWDAGGKLDGER